MWVDNHSDLPVVFDPVLRCEEQDVNVRIGRESQVCDQVLLVLIDVQDFPEHLARLLRLCYRHVKLDASPAFTGDCVLHDRQVVVLLLSVLVHVTLIILVMRQLVALRWTGEADDCRYSALGDVVLLQNEQVLAWLSRV